MGSFVEPFELMNSMHETDITWHIVLVILA